MTGIVCALGSLSAASIVAAPYTPRVGASLACTLALNVAMVAANVHLEANHPIRLVGPVIMMAIAYSETHDPPNVKAYSIARAVFALSFASLFAPLGFVLWGEWPMPVAVTAVCLVIVGLALTKKGPKT